MTESNEMTMEEQPSANILVKAPYSEASSSWPSRGRHILASFDNDTIVVYQAFNKEIANYAVQHQLFGGPAYSTQRMTWIKTNFLWMNYRTNWGRKDANQTCTLAIYIHRTAFETILQQAWPSSYSTVARRRFGSKSKWKAVKHDSGAVLQWDPDHDYEGRPLERRAIQIGIRPALVESLFNTRECIQRIEDISSFVAEQHQRIQQGEEPIVMKERVYTVASEKLAYDLGIDSVIGDEE